MGKLLYSFFLIDDSARTVNDVVMRFVFICSLTVILYLLDLHIEVFFPCTWCTAFPWVDCDCPSSAAISLVNVFQAYLSFRIHIV